MKARLRRWYLKRIYKPCGPPQSVFGRLYQHRIDGTYANRVIARPWTVET